ncbi:hypothetical protein HRbin02_00898 [Candidatus Calditenuaceae archaeon HR02]|nr:hypothetical protein HRbin02_00898 [Candidatus Calditenuaceae archaeon HR02]
MLNYLMRREVFFSFLLQLVLALFLAHGYDFRVNYLAGRNVVLGLSPYEGGYLEGLLAIGYGQYVQGLGETPLWALYAGLAYLVSAGNLFLFNLILKIPIITANIALSFLAMKRGGDHYFFLYNPFTLLVSAVWGKPDNVAVLLAVISITMLHRFCGPLSGAVSVMIKPLALSMTPSFIVAWWKEKKKMFIAFGASVLMFFTPFVLLGWRLGTVIYGFPNWFRSAGGISPFNFVEAVYGTSTMPSWLEPISYVSVVSLMVMVILAIKLLPTGSEGVFRLGLVSASLFFSLRPWVSEQNLLIILSLFIIVCGKLPSRLLWIIPLVFAGLNLSIPQQLYLLYPSIIHGLAALNHPIRYWLKFVVSVIWIIALWAILVKKCPWRWWI